MHSVLKYSIIVAWLILSCSPAFAENASIAILDFELKDLTLKPRTQEEMDRTASIKPSLQEILRNRWKYRIVVLDPAAQQAANKGFGYLFEHSDVAARLGRDVGAEWVVVGRVHKASFLFVYLFARLVSAQTGELVEEFIVEVKGPPEKVTGKGVARLARQIASTIRQHNKR
ncbi:DUF2380 domain-containing protein [Methylohalobius crimeensis]|uniref:DUF2380 domain-containing protein n=1 Tax=Methylohalobius crimeensis TaxID=244365 RepID=UPI0003F7B747|nr:DUF2380 domain-containing protein [Methylohalobius crimeensis]